MKILFVVPSYKPAYIYGGTIVVISMLAEQLVKEGNNVTVYTTNANGTNELEIVTDKKYNIDGVDVYYFKRITKDHTNISTKLWWNFWKNIHKFDVVHIHSWWNPLVIGAALICKIKGIKPIFSPHGMLSKYIIETNNKGKKAFIHNIIGKSLLKNSFLHVTAQTEWMESKLIVPDWEGKVIPNLVKLGANEHPREANNVFTIGFLSRIDPKKGLDILIEALSKVNFNYKLVIAGDGDEQYMDSTKELSIRCGNDDRLEWVGWRNGEQKFEFFAQLDLFALTSHNENFAVVIIEALSVGTPVIISEFVGLYDYVQKHNFGWVTTIKMPNITASLNEAFLDTEKRISITEQASNIIKTDFDNSALAQNYLAFYKQIIDSKISKTNKQTINS